ncbi:MAG: hypothetical protein PF450_16190 [Bacteroidales bacterium]|jgi:hypothetical protein|nr:hypothetical protein [Bacteroidales bacterium]
MKFELDNRTGYYQDDDNLISFSIGADTSTDVVDSSQFSNLHAPIVYNVGNHRVLLKGKNNQLPDEIQYNVGNNRLLPELIEKQVRIQEGKGLFPYKRVIKDGKPAQQWEEQKLIQNWLDSWQQMGLQDSSAEFMNKNIRDFYTFEDYWTKWRFSKSRRTGGDMPIIGLEHVDNRRGRLATTKSINVTDDPEDSDFDKVIIGNWRYGNERNFKIYDRFLPYDPLRSSVAISYHKNPSVGKIYGENKWYAGVKEWLVGMQRNPRYINSFLNNALSAKIHLVIPIQWIESTEQMLKDFCDENEAREAAGEVLAKPNGIDVGTKYTISARNKYIKAEIQKLSKFLSGADNQGKLYATYSYSTEDGNTAQWSLDPIDLKYNEYISTLNANDKRADEVILAAKGLDASISSISKEGVISKSGSDLYYNYLIYLHNLTPAERICNESINIAIRINFPKLYAEGYRVGFYNEVPAKQEDVSPNDRLQNTVNQAVQTINNVASEVKELAQNAN